MKATVSIVDIVEALQTTSEETQFYLSVNTGEVILKSEAELLSSESDEFADEYSDWKDDMQENTEAIMESEEFIPLPDQHEINEFEIMVDFCNLLEDQDRRNSLSAILHGKGDFNNFQLLLQQYGLMEQWEQFQEDSYRQIAINWCEINDIPYVDD